MNSPLEIWPSLYDYEEAISTEQETLSELHSRLDNQQQIERHIQNMTRALVHIDADVAGVCQPWCLESQNYVYGSEAFYQSRTLALLRHLQKTPHRVTTSDDILCTKQIIKPSAFNGTPRIKRIAPFAFIIFPAPTIYWMYVLMGEMAAHIDDGSFSDVLLEQYLVYLLAARTFELFATHTTAYAIDFLIDSIAHTTASGVFSHTPAELSITGTSQQLVYSCEEFVLAHELAHSKLSHPARSTLDEESAADRLAIEMLTSLPPGAFDWVNEPHFDLALTPYLGYLALRLWTNIRLSAELSIVPYMYRSKDEIEAQSRRIERLFADRIEQVERVGLLRKVGVPQSFKQVTSASQAVIARISEKELERSVVERTYSTAKSLAEGDFNALPNLRIP